MLSVPGRRGEVEPGSQETCSRPSSRNALAERGGYMQVVLSRAARTGLLVVLVLAALAPAALAAPTTVHIRVEGSSATLFDGSVTTDAKTLTKDASGPHPCDGTNRGANPTPGPTMTTALDDGSLAGGFTWDGTWFDSFKDFGRNRIGPADNAGPAPIPTGGSP